MTADLVRLDAATLGAKIAAGEVSSTEVTQACLDRIAATDERFHAFLHVDTEGALAAASAVDAARAAGEALSPLAGVPLALKDVLTQRGIPTTCGSRILEGWRPPYDSTVTARLKAAGVADHVAVGEVDTAKAKGPAAHAVDGHVGDLLGLHLWLRFKLSGWV